MLNLLDVLSAEFVDGPLEQQGEQHAHVSCPRFQISHNTREEGVRAIENSAVPRTRI